MKTNFTYVLIIRIILFILICLYSFLVFGQPDYDFQGATHKSGTPLQVNATYRFNNVRPGIHANVTIAAITGGITLSTIDNTGSGFKEAFQPTINVPAHSTGYVEFKIDFVTTVLSIDLPAIQLEVPATPIDVDGNSVTGGKIYEYDMIKMGTGYTDFNGTSNELNVTYSPGWVTGTNVAGIDYPAIDTAAKQVMFTVVNSTITSLIVRVGGNNTGTATQQRLRSIYFKKFEYPNSILAGSNLLKFNGVSTDEKTNLQWSLATGNNISTVVLEKGYTSNSFQDHAAFLLNFDGESETNFKYADTKDAERSVYYRLKITEANGKIEYSNILHFTGKKGSNNSFSVYPSQVSSTITVKMRSDSKQQGSFEVFDYSGRVVFHQSIGLLQGENNIRISDLEKLPPGNYITSIRTTEKLYSQKINKL